MGWKDFFKKKDEGPDPLHDLSLEKMEKGYLVDYDLRTWEVTACNRYDWGGGDVSLEWSLSSSDEILYLEREEDDEVYWSLSSKIDFSGLGPDIRRHIKEHDDPPESIEFDGVTYHMEEMGGGHFFRQDATQGEEFLRWSYMDDSGEKLLDIEQWGEDDFEASVGRPVAEYQFSNILPRDTVH